MARALTLEEGLATARKSVSVDSNNFRPQDIARRQNATLLFYWLGQNRSYLWVITPSKTQLLPLPTSAEIDAATKAYRESFLDPRDPLEYGNADGQKLYETLIRPAEKFIPKNSRVILLPDGSLNGLNFETLIVSAPQPHYWIEDVTVSIANSLALLSRSNHETPPRPGNLLFFGDALSASKDFPPLPDPGKEADILKKYFPDAHRTVFTGANAKASLYLSSNPAQFSYLHFATHGTASRTRPLESAIILSPEGDSFKLYARDIVEHPIHSFLVTISACDGAGKRVYAGEGLVGLSWAFLRAGAHYVVAGLWEVSSASTPQLMDDFYKGISSGQDPATALRNAKLSLIHSGGIFKKPFYWAPFQLYSGS
jgi:CHAT domain-containing protein